MGLFKNFISQTRKPEGALGKMMLKGMNSGHARMADWGLSHLPVIHPEEITDLGCGGILNFPCRRPGNTTRKLLPPGGAQFAGATSRPLIFLRGNTIWRPRLKRFISGRDWRSALPRCTGY